MNVIAEDLEKARALLPGLFKFQDSEPFSQAVLAVNEEMLFVYNDHAPDFKEGNNLQYRVRIRFPKASIDTIFNEKIVKQPDLKGLNRLSIMTRDEDAFYFYYFEQDKALVKNFVAALKHFHYSVETNKTNLKF